MRPGIDTKEAPGLRKPANGVWVQPVTRASNLTGSDDFTFLGRTRRLSETGWDDPRVEKLWRYNLHYFAYLNAYGAADREASHRQLMNHWVRENPPGRGTGWEPYPTSLRIVNWVKWALGGRRFSAECLHSLAIQARWLARRLEFHLLGNHLLTNAKALVFSGLFFEGPEADKWIRKGCRILERELSEQILTDGGHFERSPMYHALALEDLIDLINLLDAFEETVPEAATSLRGRLVTHVHPMGTWLKAMSHPDGELGFFNDAAFGIAPTFRDLERYADRLGQAPISEQFERVTHLASTGYMRVQDDEMVVIIDVAPIGPDYLPGHGHADTLSFECSLYGQRLFVNSGTSQYGVGAERLRQRGTSAHNTVVIDGVNSSEVWSGFRVGRRAKPIGLEVATRGVLDISCAHDGYQRLSGRPIHHRRWRFAPGSMRIKDRIMGRFSKAEARFHLHPDITVRRPEPAGPSEATIHLTLPTGRTVEVTYRGGLVGLETTTWHPSFGASVPSICITAHFDGPELQTLVEWDHLK